MKHSSFFQLLKRDIANIFHTNRFSMIAVAGIFGLSAVLSDMKKTISTPQYGVLDYMIHAFYGWYPFSDSGNGVFQLPLSWFILLYFCVYTSLAYPAQDLNLSGTQCLTRTKSRQQWWAAKCLSIVFWNIIYLLIGIVVFSAFTVLQQNRFLWLTTMERSSEQIITVCLRLLLFCILLSLVSFCLCMFTFKESGHLFSISYLTIVAFIQPPFTIGSYSMMIRCADVMNTGLDGFSGIVLFTLISILVYFCGRFLFLHCDIYQKNTGDSDDSSCT